MCGIFWYKWAKNSAEKILLHGLERLEYRGYDSAGMRVSDQAADIKTFKAVGKVSNLAAKVTAQVPHDANYTMGIAHTRWATHGGVTDENTHPHHDKNGHFYVVHNGIIENYHKLKQDLIAKWYTFYGETDTEVFANLLDANWTGNFLQTVEKCLTQIRWAYAMLIVSDYAPGEMIGVKLGSPFIFGYNAKNDFFFSSDKQALAGYAEQLFFLEDGDLVHVQGNEYIIKSNGVSMKKNFEIMDIDALQASKGDYKHFMLKEIFEQPAIIRRICKWRVNFDTNVLMAEAFHGMQDEQFKKIVFVGCGTSYNAGRLGTYWMQNLVWVDSYCEIASEYEYKHINVTDDTLYVFISQSGETADSIECLKYIKSKWGKTFGIVNVVGSTISRLTDHGLFTRAGAEIGVASTKAFTAQITCILLLALYLGRKRSLDTQQYEQILTELEKIPSLIEQILDQTDAIKSIAEQLSAYKDYFFLGRHYHVPIATESSLKFKEITYLHSEAYPAGELKHGPLALIDEKIPTIVFVPHDAMYEKNLSTIQEVKARKGKILSISDQEIVADRHITIPETIDALYPFLGAVVGQLLSYYTADHLNKDIDKPRNLAKSVTVK